MNFVPSKLAGQELERLALFIASITDYAIYMLTPDGHVASWNAAAQRFKGYTPDEIIGQHFSRFYTEEEQQAGVPAFALQQARDAGKFEAEGWRVRKDGTRFWASVVIDPIRDEHQHLQGFAKITRDITDRRAAEDELRQSEQRFRLLVQGVTDYAIYMLSPDGDITNWNEGARRIKGYEHDEVVGTHFSRFYTAEDQAAGAPDRALLKAASEGRFEAEGWRIRKDGTRFRAHVIIDAIRNDQGGLIGFAKITRDITERRRAQAELESAREALFQSQKLEALGKLTGGVAHDFNNLLNVVANGLSMMRKKTVQPADLRLIDTMDQAIRRGASLTQQLLTFARQQPQVRERRDLSRVISSFESVLRRAGQKGTAFAIELADDLPLAEVDVAQVETGLLNLVVNALDATGVDGHITVATRAVHLRAGEIRSLAEGRYVAVTVQDDGHGMPADVARRAIEPFFTTKPVGKGTGLGLSQVYGMVQQSGGDLLIDSTEGQGTSITMYFPAVDGDHVEATADVAANVEVVLVVDDQADVLEVTSELFQSLGFDVLVAESGEEALDLLRATPGVNLLFSDVAMRGMTGVELARQATAFSPELNVILVSGYAGGPEVSAQSGGQLEGFHFIQKPYRVNDVVRKLRALG